VLAGGAGAPAGKLGLTEGEVAARKSTEDLRASVAGRIGRALEPVFQPLGFDWKIVTAMIGAFAAKEVFVSQLGIVYSISDAGGEHGADSLRTLLSPATTRRWWASA